MILLPQTHWQIRTTTEKGRGLFAAQDIRPGTVIGDYIGKVIKTAEEDTSEKNGLYLLYYHDYASIYPEDLNAPGIHLINHSCTPTCWIYTYKGHTLFFALRKIFAGEELTASYLLSPDEFCSPCPHVCKCGSKYCTGTMHLSPARFKAWTRFNEAQVARTKRAGIRYGKILSKLPDYPKSIADDPIYDLFASDKQTELDLSETLPEITSIRKRIRASGKSIVFPKQKVKVVGIQNNTYITELL